MQVVDLLITMAKAACFSQRKATIMTPFPNIVDPDHMEPGKLAFSDKVRLLTVCGKSFRHFSDGHSFFLCLPVIEQRYHYRGKKKKTAPSLIMTCSLLKQSINALPLELKIPTICEDEKFICEQYMCMFFFLCEKKFFFSCKTKISS